MTPLIVTSLRRCRLSLFITFLLSGLYSSASLSAPLTVVELFTSQGCYSCPPADDLLGELKQDPNTIALSCHVTYWNYLGWKDTFSHAFCDQRQRSYQAHLRGRAGVYTPQMIINGKYGVVGSRRSSVKSTLNRAQEQNTAIIALEENTATQLSITLPELKNTGLQQLFLLGTSGHQRLPIKRGENGGKTLSYHNPVAQVIELGEWKGEKRTLLQNIKKDASIKEWVVIAQQSPLGTISAAGKLKLR
ncbi:MAG: DUF1223 domain-containing protein [Cellvibrionaceae bacterium]